MKAQKNPLALLLCSATFNQTVLASIARVSGSRKHGERLYSFGYMYASGRNDFLFLLNACRVEPERHPLNVPRRSATAGLTREFFAPSLFETLFFWTESISRTQSLRSAHHVPEVSMSAITNWATRRFDAWPIHWGWRAIYIALAAFWAGVASWIFS